MEKVIHYAIIPAGYLAEWRIYPSFAAMKEYYTRAYEGSGRKVVFKAIKPHKHPAE